MIKQSEFKVKLSPLAKTLDKLLETIEAQMKILRKNQLKLMDTNRGYSEPKIRSADQQFSIHLENVMDVKRAAAESKHRNIR